MNKTIMNVPKANALSLIHFHFSKSGEIIEKTFQSTNINNKTNIINLKKPGNDGIISPNRIIK